MKKSPENQVLEDIIAANHISNELFQARIVGPYPSFDKMLEIAKMIATERQHREKI